MGLSNNYKNYILNALFRATYASSFSAVNIVQLATGIILDTDDLHTDVKTPPTEANYSNKIYLANATNWQVIPSGVGYMATNKQDIEFNLPTNSWGLLTHFAVSDTDEDNKIIAHGELTSAGSPIERDEVVFESGALKVVVR